MSHRDRHPEYQEGCFGCKILTIAVAAAAMENRKPEVNKMIEREDAFEADSAAYRRLRKNGLQPKSVDGASQVEQVVTSQFDIDLGRVVPKSEESRVREGFELVREAGL